MGRANSVPALTAVPARSCAAPAKRRLLRQISVLPSCTSATVTTLRATRGGSGVAIASSRAANIGACSRPIRAAGVPSRAPRAHHSAVSSSSMCSSFCTE